MPLLILGRCNIKPIERQTSKAKCPKCVERFWGPDVSDLLIYFKCYLGDQRDSFSSPCYSSDWEVCEYNKEKTKCHGSDCEWCRDKGTPVCGYKPVKEYQYKICLGKIDFTSIKYYTLEEGDIVFDQFYSAEPYPPSERIRK